MDDIDVVTPQESGQQGRRAERFHRRVSPFHFRGPASDGQNPVGYPMFGQILGKQAFSVQNNQRLESLGIEVSDHVQGTEMRPAHGRPDEGKQHSYGLPMGHCLTFFYAPLKLRTGA
jgi:hypothetical protein